MWNGGMASLVAQLKPIKFLNVGYERSIELRLQVCEGK